MKREIECLEGREAAERFDAGMSKILSISRAELLRREMEYEKQAALNPGKGGPKPESAVSLSPDVRPFA
jgi:hypothetical protein